MSTAESTSCLALKSWLSEHGGGFHPKTRFNQDASGSGVLVTDDLPKDLTVVSCPFELVITQTVAKTSVLQILGDSMVIQTHEWSERQWIGTYISLHWIISQQYERFRGSDTLLHARYLDTLPAPDKLRTPLHFSPAELELFKGTNLYGATMDREWEWRKEWNQCNEIVAQVNTFLGELFTWDRYLTAATYVSSRAFPSSLLSPTPTLVHSPSTQPILIPGVDALNHARGQPVSWLVTYPDDRGTTNGATSEQPKISLVIHSPPVKGQELFNNYGPKPNSELILGYGFSIPNNPDDTIVLKIAGVGGNKWEVGRDSRGAEGLWNEILLNFVESEEQRPTYEDVLDASAMLQEMLQALIQRLPIDQEPHTSEVRPEVATMFRHYLEGQKDILFSLMEFSRAREQDAISMASDEGINLVLDDD
ncbi:hypothetical protein BDZ97DRAFT_1902516 [Flammula alnicola]|nr:hypothetical protein BDZ97DRAFT_1902516 [Flammula alnicola]